MGAGKTSARFVLAWALLAGAASANYHFLHYAGREAPFVPIPEKFDLNALPDRTLYFFVSEQGPEQLAPGDSFASTLSQIRQAARVWSDVETSELRLAFGGLFTPGTPQSTPGVEVLFDELPPGLVAMGGPITRAEMATPESGSFIPITRSVLILQKDLSQRPSFTNTFFLTAVHELGHTLGLQHTLTSSVMSTGVTRATTRAKPLAADDVAGLSTLYPTADFASQVGVVSGRVMLDGQGVHLASVVALAPDGAAVSALTDPDGSYHITGLRPGLYYLYAHPLPPSVQPELGPADIVLPLDPDGNPFPAGPLFQAQFYPGTTDVQQANVVTVQPGSALEGFDFAVQPRSELQLYGVTTYSFPGNVAVKPAFLNVNGSRNFLVASGVGLIRDNQPAPGLRAGVVGGSARIADDGVRAYAPAPAFLQLDFTFSPFSGSGPRHLVFSLDGDLYVLPAGLTLVRRQPPSVTSATPAFDESGRRLVSITGTGLSWTTGIQFDGLPATVLSVDESNGTMMVVPPPGASGHRAIVTAISPDGQDSLFLDALAPPSYTYDEAEPAFISVTPNALPAGSEAMIEITGVNTNFANGQTIVGFGSSDVVVRRIWVLGPAHLLANVHVSPAAPAIPAQLTVATGFEVISEPAAFQVQPFDPQVRVPNPELVNPATGQPSIYAGGPALLSVSNLPDNSSELTITVNDYPAPILSMESGRVAFAAPAELNVGPAVLRLFVGGELVARIVVAIDPPPPVITAVSSGSGLAVDAEHPVGPGELLVITVAGLAEPGITEAPGLVQVNVGGLNHVPAKVITSEADPNVHFLEMLLSPEVPAGARVPVTVTIKHRTSNPFFIPVGAVQEPQ